MVLKRLQEELITENFQHHSVSLLDKSFNIVDYSVASQQVSLHQPLVRLLAAMSLYLDNFGLSFTPEDFKLADTELPSLGSVLELPLRTSVLVSQVHAGMG